MRRLLPLVLLLGLLAAPARAAALPPVRHVVVVFLENKDYVDTFGANTEAPYFAGPLAHSGQLLTQYYGIGHLSLDNYIAIVSGQAPNVATQSDCQTFEDFRMVGMAADGQAVGQGCVYPKSVLTLADQLEAKGLTWKGYMEDMGVPCRHPAIGARDDTQSAKASDQYATRHNPWVYFHSVIDEPSCAQNDVPLDRLTADFADPATTPNFAFITPDLCSDGHDEPCIDGRPGGLKSADAWLREWVPRIVGSPAFQQDGLLLITFDEAEDDASACCNEQPGPNTPNPGGPERGPGGGRIGGVVLSPFVEPGSVNPAAYNHYSVLRTVEDLFGLEHLGFAGQAGLRPFGDDVFTRTTSAGTPVPDPAAAPVASCARPPLPAGRRLPRGSLIASAAIRRADGRRVLRVRSARAARLYIRAGRRGRRIGPPSIRACQTVTVVLPRRHGVVRLAASVVRGTERRTIRY